MREPFLRSFFATNATEDSWLRRVRENVGQLFAPAHFTPSSATGAPIHVLKFDKSSRPARAQSASLLTHAALFAAIVLVVAHPPGKGPNVLPPDTRGHGPLTLPSDVFRVIHGAHPSDGNGNGGGQNPIPTTRGSLAPISSLQLLGPTLPQNQNPQLPVPPTVFDPNAMPVLTSIDKMGLPWMPNDTKSPGPGNGNTIGSRGGKTMGDSEAGTGGKGNSPYPYSPGVTLPGCAYCPYPTYTDEARHVKVQGTVTMQVLVGPDGRAVEIRLVKGLGYGLDERAVASVRGWKFVPGRDGARRAVAAWVTVEAVFRLF